MHLQSLFLLSVLCCLVVGEHPQDANINVQGSRSGRFLGLEPQFWDRMEKGVQNSVDAIERLANNLEVTFGNLIPRQFRNSANEKQYSDEPINIDAIGGAIGAGIDDGLKVFFDGDEGDADEAQKEGTVFKPSNFPRPDVFASPQRPLSPFSNIFGGGDIFNIFRSQPWWKRDNVCIDHEEIDEAETEEKNKPEIQPEVVPEIQPEVELPVESKANESTTEATEPIPQVEIFGPTRIFGSFEMSTCSDNGQKYSCVKSIRRNGLHKTIRTTYRCCHGFIRGKDGCNKVDLHPMMKTLEILDSADDFVTLLKYDSLKDLLANSNMTIFAPTNEAIEEFKSAQEEQNEIVDTNQSRLESTEDEETIVRNHMVDGFVFAADFEDEMLLKTLSNKSPLRINTYNRQESLVTVNCARILTANQHSMNGVVHTIDRVLEPVQKTLGQIIDKDPQFSTLRKLLANTDWQEKLREQDGVTFLAPTNAAFEKLDPVTLATLMEANSCLQTIMEHHILPNTICSSAIQGRMKTETVSGEFLTVERTEDDKLFVDGAQIVAKDIVASNGVLHIVDKVRIPEHAKPVREVLEYHNLTKFLELLEEADLLKEMDKSEEFLAVFAPTNAAVDAIPKEEMDQLKGDKEKLKKMLRYHLALDADGIYKNNEVATTQADQPLRINFYSRRPLLENFLTLERTVPMKVTAGCSRVSIMNSKACGAVVHVIEDMLQIPETNVLSDLDKETFSIFKKLVADAGLGKKLTDEGPFTVFAPSDNVFKNLPEEELTKIQQDEEIRKKIVERHIVYEHICCSGINANTWPFMDRKRTLDNTPIHVRRTPYGQLMTGSARIIRCGNPSLNGIVHSVNRLVFSDRELARIFRGKNQQTPRFKFPGLNRLFFV